MLDQILGPLCIIDFSAIELYIMEIAARVPHRARADFEKERFHYEHSSCFHGADCRAH